MAVRFDPLLNSLRMDDRQWEFRTGTYEAFVNKAPDKSIIDVGLNSTTPYTVAGGIAPDLNIVANNGNPGLNIVGISSHGSGSFYDLGSLLFFNRSRGTADAPTAIQNGDYVGGLVFGGYGQGDYQLSLTGLIATATDDWDVTPNSFRLNWMLGSTPIFYTDNTSLTTILQPFQFDTFISINTPYSINNRLKINGAGTPSSTAELMVTASAAGRTPLVLQGFGSQTADLLQIQSDAGVNLLNVSSSGVVGLSDGTEATPSLAFIGDPNTGIFSGGANALAFSTDGAERARFTSGGNFIPADDNTYTNGSALARWSQTISMIFRGANQSAATPTYSFNNDTDTGLYYTGTSNQIGFATGGIAQAIMDGSDNTTPLIEMLPTDRTLTATKILLGVDNTFTLNFVNAVSPVAYNYASTLIYSQNGYGFGSGIGFWMHPLIQNNSGSTRSIGPWLGYLSNPTYQANGGSLTVGYAIDNATQAIFNRINSGTILATAHAGYWAQGGTVDTGATVTTRYGFIFQETGTINGTLTNSAGLVSAALLGTNKTHLLLGTGTVPSGNYAIYSASTDASSFAGDISVPDEAYGVGWNGSLEVPTKNALYDKIETIAGGSPGGSDTEVQYNNAGAFAGTSGVQIIGGQLTLGTSLIMTSGNIEMANGVISWDYGGGHVIILDAGYTSAAHTLALPDLDGTLVVDVYNNDIEITDSSKGIILTSPDSTRWRLTVDNSGTAVFTVA